MSDCPRGSSGWWAHRNASGRGSSAVNKTLGAFASLFEALNEDQFPGASKAVFNVPIGGKIPGFTRHGLNQAISREGVGVTQAAMRDAVANPLRVLHQEGGKVLYVGRNARVVLNTDGEVVTTMALSRGAWRIVP